MGEQQYNKYNLKPVKPDTFLFILIYYSLLKVQEDLRKSSDCIKSQQTNRQLHSNIFSVLFFHCLRQTILQYKSS